MPTINIDIKNKYSPQFEQELINTVILYVNRY